MTNDAGDDLLWRHLKSVPAFRALLRAVEARFYHYLRQAGEIQEPILDIGCGDGHFAQMAFDEPVTAGIDPWWGPLQKARRAAGHQFVLQAMGDCLPFPDNTFTTVYSNSVLEHIAGVQAVLCEANRVLQPGGKLVVTVPSHYFTEFLGGADFLAVLGLEGMAERYRRFFNFISRHQHTDPPEQWAERLAQAGFAIDQWQYYFSQEALRALEWGHVQGLPSAVLHFLTGHWIIAPWASNLRRTEGWVRPFYEEKTPPAGAYLLFVAHKQEHGPVSPHLPRATPLEPGQWQPGAKVEATMTAGEEDSAGSGQPSAFSTQHSAPGRRPSALIARARRFIPVGLVVLSLLFAAVGQFILSGRPEEPWAGLRWYGYSLVTLLFLAWYSGAFAWLKLPAVPRPRPAAIPRQRWYYLVALLVALLAERQVSQPANQQPALALFFWLVAIGLALYALWPAISPETTAPAGPAGGRATTGNALTVVRPAEVATIATLFLVALILRLVALTSHPFILNGNEASIGLDAWAVVTNQLRNPFATGWLTNPTMPAFLLAIPLQLFGPTVLGVRILSPVAGALAVVAIYLIGRRLWGAAVGLVAAVLLAGSHFHLHYSRLGMTNAWDPLVTLLALGLLASAWQRGMRQAEGEGTDAVRRRWLLAGLAVGLNAYFYTSSHLFPLMLAGLLLLVLLTNRQQLWRQGSHLLAAGGVALIVALPILLHYNRSPDVFMDRANSLGIFQSGRLIDESTRTGRSSGEILGQQLSKAALAFNYSLDTSTSYNPGRPLLSFWPAVFFILGLAIAVARFRQVRYGLLLVWLGVTVVFAGALLENPPSSHRLLIAAPAVSLLAALALVTLGRKLLAGLVPAGKEGQPDRAKRYLLPGLLLLASLFALGDVFFYFGSYRAEHRFGDRNTEIAYAMANYLNSLEGEWTAYFYGPPSMYIGFPTIPFLATSFRANENLFDVTEMGLAPDEPATNLVLIYLPERSSELAMAQERWPGGRLRSFSGVYADPLFYVYEVVNEENGVLYNDFSNR